MDAAARIEIGLFASCRELGPVGMAADNHDIPLLVPSIITLFYFVTLASVFSGTCGIFYTDDVQKLPYISNQKIGYSPKLIVNQVSLMTVDNKYFLPCITML